MKTYTPSPLNTENITLPDNLTELTEAMARNVHEVCFGKSERRMEIRRDTQ